MSDEVIAKLIVMDTGPLITLAAAESLDYLLYPDVPLYVPDAVLYEATRDGDALGASQILDWVQARSERVHPLPTEAFFNYVRSREEPSVHRPRREKDLGERAALEAIHDSIRLAENERAVLMTEDDRVLRRVLVLEAELTRRMIPITTRDFLIGMEQARRIQSADEVYRRAEDAGRFASRRRALDQQHEEARAAVEAVLRSRDA